MPIDKHPLSLLNNPADYVAWQNEVGQDEAKRQINEAARKHIAEHGPRSALDIGEALDNASAQIGEFVV
jgi:hypothetical protein